ncbi:hypothetical protein J3Q64DRAFT_1709448 [Phycomyces blakesleeanus]|uniref:Homeodomain-like DNA binding domain-containing transcription factor n=1 Tax=Phycomyces blakesleeanus TaxID=4837 RepID=A0ABR3BD57_PHYBL
MSYFQAGRRSNVHFETTPHAYYEHYSIAAPNYDLYPSLSRRLGNGHTHQPTKPPRREAQMDFAAMNVMTNETFGYEQNRQPHPYVPPFQPAPVVEQQFDWDLYPLIRRNVSTYKQIYGDL